MTGLDEPDLDRLNERLAAAVKATGLGARRHPDGVAIIGFDIVVAVVAVWDNPDKPPPGAPRTFGVQIGIRGAVLFGEDVYEYSYGVGCDDDDAAEAALRRWTSLDLPVLTEAASGDVKTCVHLTIAPNEQNGLTTGPWDIYAGPLNYVAGDAGARPCCHACLLTMSMPALLPLLAEPKSFAVKIVASKHEDGTTSADCRRNGEDVSEAITAIAEAAKAWPTIKGTQTRRQYIFFKAPGVAAD